MRITIEIADELVADLVPAGQDPARVLLELSVAEAYREGRLSLEQVRRLLGLGTRMEADAFLLQRQIFDDMTVEELKAEFETVRSIAAERALQHAL